VTISRVISSWDSTDLSRSSDSVNSAIRYNSSSIRARAAASRASSSSNNEPIVAPKVLTTP
jgi:hypothetical protein